MDSKARKTSDGPPADRLIREIPLIERYARHNEAEDWRFREHLKTRLNRPQAETDAVVRAVTDEIWQQIDCTTCGNCCRTLQVVVDKEDIARLSERLKIDQVQFTRRYTKLEDGTRYFSSSPCVFLGEDNRCTVYEDRPKACRDFPYLHEPHFTSRSLMMINNTAVCPIVFNVWQTLKVRFGFKRTKPAAGR